MSSAAQYLADLKMKDYILRSVEEIMKVYDLYVLEDFVSEGVTPTEAFHISFRQTQTLHYKLRKLSVSLHCLRAKIIHTLLKDVSK